MYVYNVYNIYVLCNVCICNIHNIYGTSVYNSFVNRCIIVTLSILKVVARERNNDNYSIHIVNEIAFQHDVMDIQLI